LSSEVVDHLASHGYLVPGHEEDAQDVRLSLCKYKNQKSKDRYRGCNEHTITRDAKATPEEWTYRSLAVRHPKLCHEDMPVVIVGELFHDRNYAHEYTLLMLTTAPRYGDIIGPITKLLEEDDLAIVYAHKRTHACFPRRFALGLMHRAIDYQCIPDQCPHASDDGPAPPVGTRRLRSDDADEVSSVNTPYDSISLTHRRPGVTTTDQGSA
jgi:hypothetical protein